MQQLFGVFASHSPESCPMNNNESRKKFISIGETIQSKLSKHRISRMPGFYLSALEHEMVMILEGESAHDIESFCIDVGLSSFSKIKIVPLNTFDSVLKKVKGAA